MFEDKSKRYMTRTVSEAVHAEILIILWNLIDEQREQGLELDYMQVFELREREGKQQIVHRQEIPWRRNELVYQLEQATPFEGHIWCFDNEDYQMMLFPEDY